MTRKSYDELQEELRQAQQYIYNLIHDDVYGVINERAYPHEYQRARPSIRNMAVVRIDKDHNANHVKRALHVRHPGVLLIALPIPLHFVCLLTHDPESWCVRVKATMNKYKQVCTCAWVPVAGHNPELDFLTCQELIRLTDTVEVLL